MAWCHAQQFSTPKKKMYFHPLSSVLNMMLMYE